MSWYIFSALNILVGSVSTLFQKLSMKHEESNPVVSAIVFQFLLALFSGAFAFYSGFKVPSADLWPFFLISGALYAAGGVIFFKSIKLIEASEMTVLTGSGVLFTIFISFVFLHEQLTLLQIFGAVIILSAVILINYNRNTFRLTKGAWLAILGTVCYGSAVVADTYIIHRYDAISFVPIASFVPGVLLLIFYCKQFPHVIRSVRKTDKNLIIYSLLYSISAICFYLALQHGAMVSQVSTIGRASIILTVIFAAIFLKERKHVWKKIVAAVLTTVGVLLVT